MNKILFIINPISGGTSKRNFPDQAIRYLDPAKFCPYFLFTERETHAYELTLEAIQSGVDIIVAVGGDGTVNEVASALEGSDKIMGIIPSGSGNGLARSIGIPMNPMRAINKLNELKIDLIDSAILNDYKFFNVAGVGFDAHVSARFAKSKTRGLLGYIQIAAAEIIRYKSQHYTLEIDGKRIERDAFLVSIANASQYGNNMYIAPFASLSDGVLDICIVKPLPIYYLPIMGFHLFNKTIHRSNYMEIIQGRNIKIHRQQSGLVHLDGEPRQIEGDLQITLKPLSLRVIH